MPGSQTVTFERSLMLVALAETGRSRLPQIGRDRPFQYSALHQRHLRSARLAQSSGRQGQITSER
jgi:hypothetical protein